MKAALDLDWGTKTAKSEALGQIVEELGRWTGWLEKQVELSLEEGPLKEAMDTVEEILEQDTEPNPEGEGRIVKKGVAKDRRISIEDSEMRHGRKSKSKRVDGYKQHFLGDLDSQVIREVVVRPANEPEQEAIDYFEQELEGGEGLAELAIDLGYAGHEKIAQWEEEGVKVVARPWRQINNKGHFTKEEFDLDFEKGTVGCPAGEEMPLVLGKVTEFPPEKCKGCELRDQCTSAKEDRGRSIRIREDEELQAARRERMKTPEGRAQLRNRVMIEHRIAHHVARQGRKARYIGTRKNQFDGRRHAAVNNLFLAARYFEQAEATRMAA